VFKCGVVGFSVDGVDYFVLFVEVFDMIGVGDVLVVGFFVGGL